MITQPDKRISRKALKVWRISGLIGSLIPWVVAGSAAALAFIFEWPAWIPIVLGILSLVYTLLGAFVFPSLRWKWWRYEVREQEIELQQGMFVIKRTIVPMVRVQHVDTIQGPLLKRYKLSAVLISTAATTHGIPALEEEEAEMLRVQISKLARVADEDV